MNILRLRSMKIEHLLNVQERVQNFYLVNYEALKEHNEYLANIANEFQIELMHAEIAGEDRYMGRAPGTMFSPTAYPAFHEHDLDYILQELDWELELKIGYSQADYQAL